MNGETSKVSMLECILINWATPLEYPLVAYLNLNHPGHSPKHAPYFEKYGSWGGLVASKKSDYKRLIRAGNGEKDVSDRVLTLYNNTLCGTAMVLVSKCMRK